MLQRSCQIGKSEKPSRFFQLLDRLRVPSGERIRLEKVVVGLTVIGLDGPALLWRVSVATPTDRRLSAAARAFVAELVP